MKKILLSLTMVGALIITPAIIASASSSEVEDAKENAPVSEVIEEVEAIDEINTGYECPVGNENCKREECLNGTGVCNGQGNGECDGTGQMGNGNGECDGTGLKGNGNGTGLGNGSCNGEGNGNGEGLGNGNGTGRKANMGGRGNCNR